MNRFYSRVCSGRAKCKKKFVGICIALLLVLSVAGNYVPQINALSLDLVSDVRKRIDWEMTNYYKYGKDSDTWLFGSYDAVTGYRDPLQIANFGFLSIFIQAYYATGNLTYLDWLKNSYYDILRYGVGGKVYCTEWIPITYNYSSGISEGIPMGAWNMTQNAGSIYEGSVALNHSPIILASIVLYREYGDNFYFSVAKNLTDAILKYRTNMTTGWTSVKYEARYANVFKTGTYYYWSLMSDSPTWLNALYAMYQLTGNYTYRQIIEKSWTTLVNKYPDGNWDADTFHTNGTKVSGTLATLPDTINNYGPTLAYLENETLIDWFGKSWDRYYAQWWSTNHFTAHSTSAWLGAEVGALVEIYHLSNNQTYLDWAKSNYNYWRNQLYSNKFIKFTYAADYARVFGAYWDWGQAVIRLWVATSNQPYYDHFIELWNHGNEKFLKTYGYVSELYLTGTVKTSTATITTHNFLNSMMFALITRENKYFCGYSSHILARLILIAKIDSFELTSTANITSSPKFSNNVLSFVISVFSGSTSTTKVYVGDKGKPVSLSINGNNMSEGDGWTYDYSSNIVTVTWTHSSDIEIVLIWNPTPTIGEFEAPATVYANKYFYLNATIQDPQRIEDFVNATVEISNDVVLKWDNISNTFTEYNDPNNYCTMDSSLSLRSTINATAYKLSWRIKLAWTYPEGSVNVVAANTKVYDAEGSSGEASVSGLFTFEDDLIVYAAKVNDERINPNQKTTILGTLYYQGTTTPPEDTNGITAKVNLGATLKGSTTTIGVDGTFFISLTGESNVASYSYTVFATTDENSVQNRTITIIVDKLNVIFAASKTDPAIGKTVTISWTILRQYDNSTVISFTIDISRKGTLWKSGLTTSSTTDTQFTAGSYTYDVFPTSVTDTTYNLTDFNSTPITVSWATHLPPLIVGDRIVVVALIAVLTIGAIGIKVRRLNKTRKAQSPLSPAHKSSRATLRSKFNLAISEIINV